MFELCASILAADFANLERDMRAANAAGVDAFHIDVMDGHFVPAISFGTGMVRTMERLTTKPLDVHLMVEKPLDFLPELEELGVKRVSVHYEIPGGPEAALRAICAAGMQAGLVLNPETPVESALPYLAQISQLLLMTVYPVAVDRSICPAATRRSLLPKVCCKGRGAIPSSRWMAASPPVPCPAPMRPGHGALWRVVRFSMETYIKMCVHCVRRKQNRRCL